MRATAAAVLLAGALAAGCGSSRQAAPLYALGTVMYGHEDFEGASLLRVDPTTLEPVARGLRLGDAITSRVFSPDRRTVAFGGVNYDEVLFVDAAHPGRVRRLIVVPGRKRPDLDIDVEGWPSRSRLIAVSTVAGAWWAPHPSQLLVVDPARGRVVHRTALHGSVFASVPLRDGSVALLVLRGRSPRFPRLAVVGPDGSTWTRVLRRLALTGHDGVRLGGVYYPPARVPALTSDRRGRLFVAASDRPVAEIDVPTRKVVYHALELPRGYLSKPPAETPGSAGVNLRFATSAAWLGHGQLAIGGFDDLPARVRSFGTGIRQSERELEIVDTHRWRLARSVHATDCLAAGSVTLCRAAVCCSPRDRKVPRGPSLVAYDGRWRRLYEKGPSALWWEVTAGRLFAGSPEGDRIVELDPLTGRTVRRIRPAPLANAMWPLELFSWKTA